VQPLTHERLVQEAIERADSAWAREQRPALLQGSADEDVHIVPLLRWRLQSWGLSHTYRPGRSRGELLAPSALERSRRLLARALAHDSAHDLGRIAHLLVDAAVPARTRGVWHIFGDPLESWAEEHVSELAALGVAPIPEASSLDEIFQGLAALSSRYPADGTKTPWGILLHQVSARPVVTTDEAAAQAKILVPAAVSHVAALLRLFGRLRAPAPNGAQP
jgi:hypothetical protein